MEIEALSLIASSRCNLRCSYCFLCKLDFANNLDDIIIQSIKDNSYLQNCLTTLSKMNSLPQNIKKIEFWGGEPTLNLSLWTEYLDNWGKAFFNVESLEFITNGTYKVEDMLNFINKSKKCFPLLKKIVLQTSIDGPDDITEKYRGIKADVIIDTCIELVSAFNHIVLPVDIDLVFKPTLDIDCLNQIHSTIESATNYYTWWAQQIFRIESSCYNKRFFGVCVSVPIFTLLYDYTQQQGLDYAHSLLVYESIDWDKIHKTYEMTHDLYESTNISSLLHEYANNKYDTAYYCGAYNGALMIRQDGSVIGCLAGLYNDSKEYEQELKDANLQEELSIQKMIPKQFYLYPSDNNRDIKEFREHIEIIKSSLPTNLALGVAIGYELAECGQINAEYKNDLLLLLQHIKLLQSKTLCFYNNLRKNGLMYVSLPGLYRLFLNGFLQEYDRNVKYKFMKGEQNDTASNQE